MSDKSSNIPFSEMVRAMRNKLAPNIKDKVLHIHSGTFDTQFDKTLVYGVMCTGYGSLEYDEDVRTIKDRYGLKEEDIIRYTIKGSDMVPDEDAAFRDISEIMDKSINGNQAIKKLRIVEAGIKETRLILDVFNYMLTTWRPDGHENKKVQFIHVRGDDDMLMFWKKACLKHKSYNLEVEYVNRRDYTAMGLLE